MTDADADPRYRPIGDYAVIGDCHSAALVSSTASIDWCCMPRFDSASVFGRLLDADRGGFCSITPTDPDAGTSRGYLEDTLVLCTTMRTPSGEARLYDCFAMRDGGSTNPWRQLLRIIEGVRGQIDVDVRLSPRFDYGEVKPWLRFHGPRLFSAVGGNDALVVSGDLDLSIVDDHDLAATVKLVAGERVRLSIVAARPEHIDPAPPDPPTSADLDDRLDETIAWWRRWSDKAGLEGPERPGARRSAITLKALINAPTGAAVAAVTTSLPETMGGSRNWDYRFSWVRDSEFTVRTLADLGGVAEADGFRRFIERSSAGSADTLQIMYGLGGERRLTESELTELEGYRGSSPVRIGNAASNQLQLDVYGYLVELSWQWHLRGHSPDDDYWRFLVSLVDAAVERWDRPDCGIWEVRGTPQHFVHSKVMCWVAVDRGLRLAEECMRRAPEKRWKAARADMKAAIDERGFDANRNTFVQAFDSDELDAALLLLPMFGFVGFDDPRMVGTTDAVAAALDDHGLVRRYVADDGLPGREGAFVPCTFWLAECLARQGRITEARAAFTRAVSCGNDLGLFSEEYDPEHHVLLGNYPQGLSHLSHIAAARALWEQSQAKQA